MTTSKSLSNRALENAALRKTYDTIERSVLLLIILPLPVFGFVYLYSQRRLFEINLPVVPDWTEPVLFGLVLILLGYQALGYSRAIKGLLAAGLILEERMKRYGSATVFRFWMLFTSALLSALGLLLFDHAIFTVAFALTLVFISAGKPTPDRIVRILKLKGEEKEAVMDLRRRG